MAYSADVHSDLRGRYLGTIVCAGFGVCWAGWGAGDLPGATGPVVGVAGTLLGLALIVVSVRRLRARPAGGGRSMTGSRSFWIVGVIEILAIVVGSVVLGRIGMPELIVVWTSTVVGAHFLAFGRLFWGGFAVLGAVLVVGAGAGLVLFLLGTAHVEAVTALVAAAGLLGFALRSVLSSG